MWVEGNIGIEVPLDAESTTRSRSLLIVDLREMHFRLVISVGGLPSLRIAVTKFQPFTWYVTSGQQVTDLT